ncbi:hypothetical protein KJ636_04855 [Patescibacteria group bacterium]|nr:hypothetical protein [Patescibacteria group bacterium]MBU4481809.1 hypothetical protein [Patescibacteria group bacterium]
MTNRDILVKRRDVEKRGGVVILDLEKYQKIGEKLREYEKKERLLKNLEKFENLAKWGRDFAGKKKITQRQVIEND